MEDDGDDGGEAAPSFSSFITRIGTQRMYPFLFTVPPDTLPPFNSLVIDKLASYSAGMLMSSPLLATCLTILLLPARQI